MLLQNIHEHCSGGTLDQPLPPPLLPGAAEPPSLYKSLWHRLLPRAGHPLGIVHQIFLSFTRFIQTPGSGWTMQFLVASAAPSPLPSPLWFAMPLPPGPKLGVCFPSFPLSCLIKCPQPKLLWITWFPWSCSTTLHVNVSPRPLPARDASVRVWLHTY